MNGLRFSWMISTVLPTARKSCGLGLAGMRTKVASLATALMASVMAGGVSIKTASYPAALRDESLAGSRNRESSAIKSGSPLSRTFHQSDSEPCGSRSIKAAWQAGRFGGDGQMRGERGLSRSALLTCKHNNVHFGFLAVVFPCFQAKQRARKHARWRFLAFVPARLSCRLDFETPLMIQQKNTIQKTRTNESVFSCFRGCSKVG